MLPDFFIALVLEYFKIIFMKKLCLIAILILLPFLLLAEPNVPYLMDTVISWANLTKDEKTVMTELHTGATNHLPEIVLSKEITKEQLTKLLELLYTDYPELLSLKREYRYASNRETGLISVVKLQYLMDKSSEQLLQLEMFATAIDIVNKAPKGEYQAEQYFHDVICDKVVYSSDLDQEMIHTAYNALVKGDAVCDGYAKAMALLCRFAGIKCSVISGMSFNGDTPGFHAWNIMQINGTYTLSDLTWNDFKEYVRYDYFNVTNTEMDIDHKIVYNHIWPECSSYAVNWHNINNLLIPYASDAQLKRLVDTYVLFTAETDMTISLRFKDYDTYSRFVKNFNDWFASSMQKQGFSFSIWISPNERQQCFAIRKV